MLGRRAAARCGGVVIVEIGGAGLEKVLTNANRCLIMNRQVVSLESLQQPLPLCILGIAYNNPASSPEATLTSFGLTNIGFSLFPHRLLPPGCLLPILYSVYRILRKIFSSRIVYVSATFLNPIYRFVYFHDSVSQLSFVTSKAFINSLLYLSSAFTSLT